MSKRQHQPISIERLFHQKQFAKIEQPLQQRVQLQQLGGEILARYKAWRKIEDVDGTQGWMHARLLSASRTALVQGETGKILALRSNPRTDARARVG